MELTTEQRLRDEINRLNAKLDAADGYEAQFRNIIRKPIFMEIARERAKQDQKYGPAHDDTLTFDQWNSLIAGHLLDSHRLSHSSPLDFREAMIRTAATALAAVLSFDRKTNRNTDIQAVSAGAQMPGTG